MVKELIDRVVSIIEAAARDQYCYVDKTTGAPCGENLDGPIKALISTYSQTIIDKIRTLEHAQEEVSKEFIDTLELYLTSRKLHSKGTVLTLPKGFMVPEGVTEYAAERSIEIKIDAEERNIKIKIESETGHAKSISHTLTPGYIFPASKSPEMSKDDQEAFKRRKVIFSDYVPPMWECGRL